MCNLYGHTVTRAEYNAYFQADLDWRQELELNADYTAPGKPGYVVRVEQGKRVLSTMLWGFPTRKPRKRVPKEGQLPYLIEWWTNARNLDGSLWRNWLALPQHRCLVPFGRFAEPKAVADRTGPGDTNWWFTVRDEPVAAFAGLWKEDPELGRVFSFCTTEPNPLIGAVHPKAMPVILHPSDYEAWMTAPWDGASTLVASFPSQLMERA